MQDDLPKAEACGVTITYEGDVTVAEFTGAKILEETTIQEIAKELMKLVDAPYKVKLVLDFARVEYLSSAVLGKLIALHKKIVAEKGQFRLCAIKPSILEVFKITKLDKVMSILPNRAAAVSAMMLKK
ncbi:MAG: STAS domain-containing protein [Planctomycetes bacterium]|nr:STAS domain-containing protein [Planctomycetota bacterium]